MEGKPKEAFARDFTWSPMTATKESAIEGRRILREHYFMPRCDRARRAVGSLAGLRTTDFSGHT